MSLLLKKPLLEVVDLCVRFPIRRGIFDRVHGHISAVDRVSFQILSGETVGLVGESGCGKSSAAHAILRLTPVDSGRVLFDGQDVLGLSQKKLRSLRRDMQIIFQDPHGALNPRMKVGKIIGEGLAVHRLCSRKEQRKRVDALLERVGLATQHAERFPDEFSGGQRQRIGIARALALEPRFIVCDEAVSALDVSIQAQILNLLKDLQEERGLSYLFISHDLSVIRQMCDRVLVMYLGRLVEEGNADSVLSHPAHPYTRALMDAIPVLDTKRKRERQVLVGEVPSVIEIPSGCAFHPRCKERQSVCEREDPSWLHVDSKEKHTHRCILERKKPASN